MIGFHSIPGGVWFGLETSLVALFTVEYLLRCVAHSNSLKSFFAWIVCECFMTLFCISRDDLHIPAFFGIIDLLGILPYYIEIALQQDTVCVLIILLARCIPI